MPGLAGLQQDVERRRAVAEQQGAEELVVARRAAGQQQHVVLAVDDLHVGLAELSAGLRSSGGAAARGSTACGGRSFRRQLELDRHDLAVAAEDDLPAVDPLRPCRAARGRWPAGRPGASSSHGDASGPASPWAWTKPVTV